MARKKILLVDDSQTQILYEKMMLGGEFEILTAQNGKLGVDTALKESPDLILLDIMMPEMDGVEALKAMRAKEETKAIPIIMVTTKSDEEKVSACYELGCTDYVTKPVDKTDLLSKVNKYLNGSSGGE